MSDGYVYVVSFEDSILRRANPYAKIGKANDVEKRLSGIQTGSPLKLQMFGYIKSESPTTAEKHIHKLLKTENVMGEWFQVSQKLIRTVRTRFDVIDDRLDELVVSSEDTSETIRIRELEAHIIELNKLIEGQRMILRQNQETFIRIRDAGLTTRKSWHDDV